MQKLIFGLVMASRKLLYYFQTHEITVVTRFRFQRILRNLEATGRIVEWALELSSFGMKFESTSTIQSRALTEFIVEWTPTPDEEVLETVTPGNKAPQEWIMYVEDITIRVTRPGGAGLLIMVITRSPVPSLKTAGECGLKTQRWLKARSDNRHYGGTCSVRQE